MQKIKIPFMLFALILLPHILLAQFDSMKRDSTKKVNFAGIPIINYNSSQGYIVGGMGAMLYKLNAKDTISPSSATLLFGAYTGNETYMGLLVQKFYFKEDNWRGNFVLGGGEFHFQFYPGLPLSSSGRFRNDGIWVDYESDVRFMLTEIQRQVIPNFYLGLEVLLIDAETLYEIPNIDIQPSDKSVMNSLGYTLQFDNRDNVNFPVKGYFCNFKNRFIREEFGSTENFERYELSLNNFWDLKKNSKSVLVSRLYANIAAGDVPFQGQNFIGGDDLRGYSKGEFRGNQVYAIQAELRQNIYKKFGMIGFLGVGSAVDKISEIPDSDILPSIGIGLRYLMIAKEKLNVGIDVGKGKNDWSLTFRIGEAFSR